MRVCELPNNGQADHADVNYDGKLLKGMDLKEKRVKERNTLQELEPAAVQVLHELVSLVHNSVNANQDRQSLSTSTNGYELVVNDKFEKIVSADFKDDPVAKFLWDINPQTLQDVFLAMVHNFPRTLEALVLHVLSPVGAEVLTRKFDEMDQHTLEEDRNGFYEAFYSVFDDQSAAMNSILKGKELFTQQVIAELGCPKESKPMLWLEKRVAMIMMVIVGLVVVMVHVLDVDANVHRVAIGEAKKVPGETVAIREAPNVDVAFGWHRVELSRSGSQLGHAERTAAPKVAAFWSSAVAERWADVAVLEGRTWRRRDVVVVVVGEDGSVEVVRFRFDGVVEAWKGLMKLVVLMLLLLCCWVGKRKRDWTKGFVVLVASWFADSLALSSANASQNAL
ncbi:hypothetical protein V8G54_030138 [Vigna mungo]|uniref:Uncharacterized protein n=1 Tax=Vigna mungo TaxID=3915 RepID=A0AAQ3MVQ8_VIGMU